MKVLGRGHGVFLRAMVVTAVVSGALPAGGTAQAARPDS